MLSQHSALALALARSFPPSRAISIETMCPHKCILIQSSELNDEGGKCDSDEGLIKFSFRRRFVVRRSSFVVRRSSFVVRRSSFVVRRSSFVVRRSSFVVRRSSFVLLPSPCTAVCHCRCRALLSTVDHHFMLWCLRSSSGSRCHSCRRQCAAVVEVVA